MKRPPIVIYPEMSVFSYMNKFIMYLLSSCYFFATEKKTKCRNFIAHNEQTNEEEKKRMESMKQMRKKKRGRKHSTEQH